ncbi:hypothetical protein QZM52_34530, partial [Burkholderia metallica]
FQHRHNLLDTEALAFHHTAPFILKKSAENSLTSWHCLLGAAHRGRSPRLKWSEEVRQVRIAQDGGNSSTTRQRKRGYRKISCNPLIPLVGAKGFEPSTL